MCRVVVKVQIVVNVQNVCNVPATYATYEPCTINILMVYHSQAVNYFDNYKGTSNSRKSYGRYNINVHLDPNVQETYITSTSNIQN